MAYEGGFQGRYQLSGRSVLRELGRINLWTLVILFGKVPRSQFSVPFCSGKVNILLIETGLHFQCLQLPRLWLHRPSSLFSSFCTATIHLRVQPRWRWGSSWQAWQVRHKKNDAVYNLPKAQRLLSHVLFPQWTLVGTTQQPRKNNTWRIWKLTGARCYFSRSTFWLLSRMN